ncbi:hypothetical protein HZ326_4896 [Fusarium oxysporum f. sp. albedinis]|nr:hypothetical protein HZ326_4896 [Fusarium oxysporum f. sp. albedinis]
MSKILLSRSRDRHVHRVAPQHNEGLVVPECHVPVQKSATREATATRTLVAIVRNETHQKPPDPMSAGRVPLQA